MSAPDTNLERQRRRHIGPLMGMAVAAIFGVGIILYWIFEDTANSPGPQGADVQIDGRTGQPSSTPPIVAPAPVEMVPAAPSTPGNGTPTQPGVQPGPVTPAAPVTPQPVQQ